MQDQGSLSVKGWRLPLPTTSEYPAIASPSLSHYVSPLSEHKGLDFPQNPAIR